MQTALKSKQPTYLMAMELAFYLAHLTAPARREGSILHAHDFNPTEIYLLQKVGSLRPSLPSYGSS